MDPLVDLLSAKAKTLSDIGTPDHTPSQDAAQDSKSPQETPIPISPVNPNLFEQVQRHVLLIKAQCDELLALVRLNSPERKEHPLLPLVPTTEVPQGNVIEGVFNGHQMIGENGKEYAVPPNYASKSKLVEGDLMKLTITPSGAFVYKQIGPIVRKRMVGELVRDPVTAHWGVVVEGKIYSILTASVTFYKGNAGDEVIILVPQDGQSSWGAVENIIKKG